MLLRDEDIKLAVESKNSITTGGLPGSVLRLGHAHSPPAATRAQHQNAIFWVDTEDQVRLRSERQLYLTSTAPYIMLSYPSFSVVAQKQAMECVQVYFYAL